jgi:hypothetical protein
MWLTRAYFVKNKHYRKYVLEKHEAVRKKRDLRLMTGSEYREIVYKFLVVV